MQNPEVQSAVDALIPLLRRFPQSEYGIALGGAHAKGTDDEESDLDLYLFAGAVHANDQRTELATHYCPDIREVVSWGVDAPFVQGGTDFRYVRLKVECWLRSSVHMEQTVQDCVNGLVKREFVTWTTTGFYNHCALSDLKVMVPVDDASGMLANWKRQIAVYPPKLRRAIIAEHLRAARFWPANFHYASAIQREDVIYTTGIIQQVIHNLIQVLFALNSVYFPGDKKLLAALEHLDNIPGDFTAQIQALLFPEQRATVKTLRLQQEVLQRLLSQVEDLVPAEMTV